MHWAFVMPRKMFFGPSRATSIDLVVHDIVSHLPNGVNVTVFAETIDEPYGDCTVAMVPRKSRVDKWRFLGRVANAIQLAGCTHVIVEQHLPAALQLKRLLPTIPIILHKHNFFLPPSGFPLARWWMARRYGGVDAIAFCSQTCADRFRLDWGRLTDTPMGVVPNGIDLASWAPSATRMLEILCVGRMAPEKGIFPLAQALAKVLPGRPHWRARFILSGMDVHPDYRDQVLRIKDQLTGQMIIEANQPWRVVKAANENAAIAVVPSVGEESFGRTALEAMAGGAALVSSTRGGLAEVVGDAVMTLDQVDADGLTQALEVLMDNLDQRQRVADAGRLRAARFSLDAQVASLVDICGRLRGNTP